MLKMMIFAIVLTLLGISLLIISYNDELEVKTIEKIHKNLRQTSITVGWILVGLGILLCVWSLAVHLKKN
jgi:hypothetical protein